MGNFTMLVLFVFKYVKYCLSFSLNGTREIHDTYEMLDWYGFFTEQGYVFSLVLFIASFFIRNRSKRLLSLIASAFVFIVIFLNVEKFNPF